MSLKLFYSEFCLLKFYATKRDLGGYRTILSHALESEPCPHIH